MSDPIAEFVADVERVSALIDMKPTDVLKSAGVHPSMWWRWKNGNVSPTMRMAHTVRLKLDDLAVERIASGKTGRAA